MPSKERAALEALDIAQTSDESSHSSPSEVRDLVHILLRLLADGLSLHRSYLHFSLNHIRKVPSCFAAL